MELELTDNGFRYQETVLETVLTREETLETIVPDACPDIDTILHTDAHFCMKRRTVEQGKLTVGGVVRCAVLYQPEEEQEAAVLETELNLTCALEQEGLTADCTVLALPRVTLAETRTMNPRKVLIRVGVAIEVTVLREKTCNLTGGVAEAEKWRMEQLFCQQEGSFLTAAGERAFSFEDDLTLPSSKPPVEEVLRLRCEPFVGEARIVGGKLIFKGGAAVVLVYRSRAGETEQAEVELPMSQVVELNGATEGASFRLELLVTDWSLSRPSLDGRSFSIELELLAQATARESKTLTLLADTYSTAYATQPTLERVMLHRLLRQETMHQTARELVETAGMIQTICDTALLVTECAAQREEGVLVLTAQCMASAVLEEEGGGFACLDRRMTVSLRIPAQEGVECRFTVRPERLDAVETSGGVELRATVSFTLTLLEKQSLSVVTAVQLEEQTDTGTQRKPSIVLRQVGAGETLWQIARHYATTRQEIIEANSMETDSPTAGQLLLIPRKH